jgi:hypothetical protein
MPQLSRPTTLHALPGSEDGISLGPVSANWSLEEFFSTPEDDDVSFVGTINDSGLFTPALEGPNPKRRKQAKTCPWITTEMSMSLHLSNQELADL